MALYPEKWNMRLYIDGTNNADMTSICENICTLEKGK